ncbi:MAG: PfkB domain-containing protein [Parcubacteria group bacterium Gr01-1014_56]|nr:MAG: PfkB domain-containing protein [Parcubacteria group bacterium Gr01-1014_56]
MKKILIIGETCLDRFVYCHAERLAPDLPVPVLSVIEETENPGMAKNVERNVKAIYEYCDIITNPGWEKVTKTRYVHRNSNHTFIRIDTDHHISRIAIHDLPLDEYELIAISDYNKGFLTEDDIKAVCERHANVFIDTKKILGGWAERAKFIKINNHEYERSKPALTPTLAQKIICTKGEFGAEYQGTLYPVTPAEVKDSTGAGDSFFAALLVRYIETGDISESIRFANGCASKVVAQKGITIIERPQKVTHEQSQNA